MAMDHYKDIETMVVSKESNAYTTMLAYAEQNDYPIAEEPFLTPLEKNALEVALDWEIESLECETEGGLYREAGSGKER